MTKIFTCLVVLATVVFLSACADRTPGEDVRLHGYDGLYPASTVE